MSEVSVPYIVPWESLSLFFNKKKHYLEQPVRQRVNAHFVKSCYCLLD
jgi:hypothetical protein